MGREARRMKDTVGGGLKASWPPFGCREPCSEGNGQNDIGFNGSVFNEVRNRFQRESGR